MRLPQDGGREMKKDNIVVRGLKKIGSGVLGLALLGFMGVKTLVDKIKGGPLE